MLALGCDSQRRNRPRYCRTPAGPRSTAPGAAKHAINWSFDPSRSGRVVAAVDSDVGSRAACEPVERERSPSVVQQLHTSAQARRALCARTSGGYPPPARRQRARERAHRARCTQRGRARTGTDQRRPGLKLGGRRVRIARGRLRVAQGRTEEGLRDLLDAARGWQRAGFGLFSAARWREEAALAHAAAGNRAEACRLAGEQVELARAFGRPRTLGVSLRAAGIVQGGVAGLALLNEAVETLERSQSPLELARALLGHGSALRRAGRRVHARTQLERALDLAHRCGARRIASQARSELIAAGARPRRDAITGRDALTASELRVARLRPKASPTAKSPRRCSSPPRPSKRTSTTSTASSTSPDAINSGARWPLWSSAVARTRASARQ
jgi:hypothetical protein